MNYVATWLNLKLVMLGKINQTEKSIYNVIAFIKKILEKCRSIVTESNIVVAWCCGVRVGQFRCRREITKGHMEAF